MYNRKVHVCALLWLLQFIALEFLPTAAIPTVSNSNTINHANPTSSYLQSLRSEHNSDKDSSSEKYKSYNLTDEKIKENTGKEVDVNIELHTPNRVEGFRYDSKRDASIGNSIIKTQGTKSNSQSISLEPDGEIVDKKRSQIDSNAVKEVQSSSFQESVASSRKSRGITIDSDMFKRESRNKLEIPNELSSNPGNHQHLIRSKRSVYRKRKNANHPSHLHKRNSSASTKKRSKSSKRFNAHKRLIDRSVQSTSPKTFIKDIIDMMKSRETPVTITAKPHSETPVPVLPVKIKKDIGSTMSDHAEDKMGKETNSQKDHTNKGFTNERKRSQKNPNNKTARSNRKSGTERRTNFNQKRHHNPLDKDIRRREKPLKLQALKHLKKRQDLESTKNLTSSSGETTVSTNIATTASGTADGSSTVVPAINSTLKSLDENQKSQLMKFTSDLKTFVWNYIDGQSGLNDTRKKFVLGKVLKSLPGLITKHIDEVI